MSLEAYEDAAWLILSAVRRERRRRRCAELLQAAIQAEASATGDQQWSARVARERAEWRLRDAVHRVHVAVEEYERTRMAIREGNTA